MFLLSQISTADFDYLHRVALEVTAACKVAPNAEIPGHGRNTTGFTLRVPGGNHEYYPAFWIRDAAMMLGGYLVPIEEIEGWARVIAAVQPGPDGLKFAHGLRVPGYSIPDHITIQGEACWYPGAYTDQGNGAYGILPPADDAFYFIQIVEQQARLARSPKFLESKVKTGWGMQPLSEVCERAFDSVAVDPKSGLVVCDPVQTRVDWGFCDSIRKTGSCLMPSLLRDIAALELASLFNLAGDPDRSHHYLNVSSDLEKQIDLAFFRPIDANHGMLVSSTGLGMQDDVWASSLAAGLSVLTPKKQRMVANHLADLVATGGIILDGQMRHLPKGQYWEQASSAQDAYQNGGYWATPTGWLYLALVNSHPVEAQKLLTDFTADLKARRTRGAPFEWINGITGQRVNANYAASITQVFLALASRR